MSEFIKVEILRDISASSPIDVAIAREGLAKVASKLSSDPFEIIEDSRKIRIARRESTPVKITNINFPKLEANYAVILTDKDIINDSVNETYGIAQRFTDQGLVNGVAIVRVNTVEPELTTAHEVGHLMNIHYDTIDTHNPHCATQGCLMTQYAQHEEVSERVRKKGIPAFLERQSLQPAEYRSVERSIAREFCPNCNEQLARRAFFALKYLNGETVSPSWL